MSLPLINIVSFTNELYKTPDSGSLLYAYAPFRNLKNTPDLVTNADLFDLRLTCLDANLNILPENKGLSIEGKSTDTPIALDTELSYDGSVNLIVNDYKNPLKIVNSRFYLTDSTHYAIADRKGNLDTNIYSPENFPIEASLIKTVRTVTGLDFLGITSGGNMPVGSYHFYFKLADADGNESDFVSESGKVVCHIGAVNHPQSIRGGLQDENSNKIIKFRLKNLDLAYNYINIYYVRKTGDGITEVTKTYKVTDKFKIKAIDTDVTITGFENHIEIDESEVNIRFTNFESVKTTANCQNITFAGNITKNYELFKTLEKYSLFVTPHLSWQEKIGNLSYNFTESYPDEGFEYYNVKNIYYKLGYWEDIYRFGIVYILNDYTLSPVFNIRGIEKLKRDTDFYSYKRNENINYREDFILEKYVDKTNLENAKGVISIEDSYTTNQNEVVFNGENSIRPIGLTFDFTNILGWDPELGDGLDTLTKGFFIVRQKRIPTVLTQGLAIATSTKTNTPLINGTFKNGGTTSSRFFAESFVYDGDGGVGTPYKPKLGRSLCPIGETDKTPNALLCPDASLRSHIYSNYFNASEFVLRKYIYGTSNRSFADESRNSDEVLFTFGRLKQIGIGSQFASKLLLVDPGIELINNGNTKFSSRAGDPIEAWKHGDTTLGDINDIVDGSGSSDDWSTSVTKIRGDFNTYLGSNSLLTFGQHYNIYQKDYDPAKLLDYFVVRYNDSAYFSPISDRLEWANIPLNISKTLYEGGHITKSVYSTKAQYRGDCYISTYAHRMNWNFIDPELPTNTKIVDPWTWYKNFKVTASKPITVVDSAGGISTALSYKRILPLFTYKDVVETDATGTDTESNGIKEPTDKKYNKYANANGEFGYTKLNRPDLNAVPIGHWAIFKVCSNVNPAMRDVDFSRPAEEAVHKMKRSFYPLQEASPSNVLPESNVINSGISVSLGDKYYFEIPDVPFIKTNFNTRINYSEILQENSFKNGNRIFMAQNYQDYTNEYGALVKLIEWYGRLVAIMEHGVFMIPVNERAMMTNAQGESVYINTDNVLPKNPKVMSNTYGSVWEDSIIKTPKFIYGIDTIGKKIWRTNGETFELISDLKVQKFLNDFISLKVIDNNRTLHTHAIKTHYNAFKYDVMFVFTYGGTTWNLCWNEMLNRWSTQFTWFPEFSENINNIFYTFANESIHNEKGNILYKHGFAGGIEESGIIKPTTWYDQTYSFEYEFVVNTVPGVQKIFDNLKIVSNLTPPESFSYEVVGESYDWKGQKDLIITLNNQAANYADLSVQYRNYLLAHPSVKKIPFIYIAGLDNTSYILKDLTIEKSTKTKETFIISYQKGADIKDPQYKRLKGNMQYVEDSWDVQIQPISFKYAYLKNGNLMFSNFMDMKIRDKYIKIRVRYDGNDYAIVNALKTLFTISYA